MPDPLFPVRHEPFARARKGDPAPYGRFYGRHEGYHYHSVARTAPRRGDSLIRSCQCGALFRWEGSHWSQMGRWGKWRHRRLLTGGDLFTEAEGPRWHRSPRFRLRRFLLRLRGWDA